MFVLYKFVRDHNNVDALAVECWYELGLPGGAPTQTVFKTGTTSTFFQSTMCVITGPPAHDMCVCSGASTRHLNSKNQP